LPENLVAPRLREIGLSWQQIRTRLLAAEGATLEQRLKDQMEMVMQGAHTSAEELAAKLAVLRNAFTGNLLADANSPLSANIVPLTVKNNISLAARSLYDSLLPYVQRYLLDYDEGPGRLRDLLVKAQIRLNELKVQPLHDPQSEAATVDEAVLKV